MSDAKNGSRLSWLSPWLSLTIFLIGLLLSIPPLWRLLSSLAVAEPTAFATIFSAAVGFSGVALTTYFGFRNLIASQAAQAANDRSSREHQLAIDQIKKNEDREFDRKVLSAALHGELTALLRTVHSLQSLYLVNYRFYEEISKDAPVSYIDVNLYFHSFRTPIFDASIAKLGLLGPSIAGDVAKAFNKAIGYTPSEGKPVKPEQAAALYKAVLDSYTNWSQEIVHVSQRLASVQGFAEDPGSLLEMEMSRETVKNEEAQPSATEDR